MTAATTHAAAVPRADAEVPAVRGEALVFWGATAVALVHAVDDAFLGRQPGVPWDQHLAAAVVALAAGGLGMAVFPRARPGFRSLLALAFGALALVNGALHVVHLLGEGAARSDPTGVLAAAAGIVLLGLGLFIPFRHRGEGAATRVGRWASRLLVAVVGALVFYVGVQGVGFGIVQAHKYREPIGEPPSAAYQPVTFAASDGLRMSGWYVESENGAAVVLVHGGGGDRTGAVDHAELLARHGYGVVLYDSRGRGESEGSPNALGWGWEKDVAGALAFLRARGIDEGRIGGLGLSTGADVLIEVAAGGDELAAVVGDGATARSFDDYRTGLGLDSAAPVLWTSFVAIRAITGGSPGEPLEELVGEVAPTPLLLIAAGRGVKGELEFNDVYAAAAREPVELWRLPGVGHTAAVRERPDEYERRVLGFFDEALADASAP